MWKTFLAMCALCAALLVNQIALADAKMILRSNDFKEGDALPLDHVADQFGCNGRNISPHLEWTGAPEGTQSFILLVFDPDAPTDSGWWHWGVYNIDKDINELARNTGSGYDQDGISMAHVRNDFGIQNFTGACPPEGDKPHRYRFSIYAMPMAELPIDGILTPALLSFFAKNYSLDQAELTTVFWR